MSQTTCSYICVIFLFLLDVIEAPAPSKGYTPKVSAIIILKVILALPHKILINWTSLLLKL